MLHSISDRRESEPKRAFYTTGTFQNTTPPAGLLTEVSGTATTGKGDWPPWPRCGPTRDSTRGCVDLPPWPSTPPPCRTPAPPISLHALRLSTYGERARVVVRLQSRRHVPCRSPAALSTTPASPKSYSPAMESWKGTPMKTLPVSSGSGVAVERRRGLAR